MSHDMPRRVSEMVQLHDYHLNNDSLQGYTLYEIEVILNNYGKSFQNFGLTPPQKDMLAQLSNRLLMEERNYNVDALMKERNDSVPKLNAQQKAIYDLIINANANHQQELIFVYGYGETGKTFLWKTIISTLRSEGKIVLVVASSGIASSLLPSGRTSHSRFKLPLELTEESLCRIIKNTHLGKLLSDTDLIIWGEAPMNDQRCFEALDRTLRDILNEPSSLFGDKSVILENMRLARPDISLEERSMVNSFASWLLDVGDGKVGQPAKEDPENTSWIDVPPSSCVPPNDQGLLNLIDFIYDQNTLQMPSAATLQQKAIICPKNKTAVVINSKVLDMVLDESTIYMSQDEATPTGNDGVETGMLYPVEHLNTLKLPRFPPHHLELKVGASVMLIQNVNLAGGLCNGTRMIVRKLMKKLIEVQIIMGTRVGEKVLTTEMELSTIAELTPNSTNKTLEAKVYKKWIAKSPPEMTSYAFCCILLDQENISLQ
ncbi:DNA helicase [Tanacetum coccineum]